MQRTAIAASGIGVHRRLNKHVLALRKTRNKDLLAADKRR
jgi:hypothetical protein